jgi:hypothetical protein
VPFHAGFIQHVLPPYSTWAHRIEHLDAITFDDLKINDVHLTFSGLGIMTGNMGDVPFLFVAHLIEIQWIPYVERFMHH